jgi:hypothetical protein
MFLPHSSFVVYLFSWGAILNYWPEFNFPRVLRSDPGRNHEHVRRSLDIAGFEGRQNLVTRLGGWMVSVAEVGAQPRGMEVGMLRR